MGCRVLLGTVGSDVHSVANTLLEKAFLDSGFAVSNLGVAVPEDEWVENVELLGPDLILIGSMNGDLLPLTSTIKKILKHVPESEIVIGGKLNLGSQGLSNAPLIKAMGVSVLEDDEISFQKIVNFCRSILESNIKSGFKEIRDAR